MAKRAQHPGIVRRYLDDPSKPFRGLGVSAKAGKRLAHHLPDQAVIGFNPERLLETFHRLGVVSGLKLREALFYRGVCTLTGTKDITEEIHQASSDALSFAWRVFTTLDHPPAAI